MLKPVSGQENAKKLELREFLSALWAVGALQKSRQIERKWCGFQESVTFNLFNVLTLEYSF